MDGFYLGNAAGSYEARSAFAYPESWSIPPLLFPLRDQLYRWTRFFTCASGKRKASSRRNLTKRAASDESESDGESEEGKWSWKQADSLNPFAHDWSRAPIHLRVLHGSA